jgi:PDZ domain
MQNKKPVRKPLGVRIPRGKAGQSLLLMLTGAIAFIAVLLYRRPAGSAPDALLRIVHPVALAHAAAEATASAGLAVGRTRASPAHTSEGQPGRGWDVNPFAPGAGGDRRTTVAASGFGIEVGSGSTGGTSAGSAPGNDQGGTAGESSEAAGQNPGSDATALASGVTPGPAENQVAKVAHGLSEAAGGVRVDQVLPGSVVGRLGLQTGDVIVSVNGAPVESPTQFAQIYEKDGLPRQIEALRGGQLILSNP